MSTPADNPPLVTRKDIEDIQRADFYALVKKLTGGAALSPNERTKLEGYLVQFGEKDTGAKPDLDKPPAEANLHDAGGKATKAAKRVRVQWIAKQLIRRVPTAEIVQMASEAWNVSDRMGRYYVEEAQKFVEECRGEEVKKRLKAMSGTTLDKALCGAIADRDWRAVAVLLEREAKLFGLDAKEVKEIQVTGHDGGPVAVLELPGGASTTEPS